MAATTAITTAAATVPAMTAIGAPGPGSDPDNQSWQGHLSKNNANSNTFINLISSTSIYDHCLRQDGTLNLVLVSNNYKSTD